MTGQDGGFRSAVARFKADVEAALTRARRASADAKQLSAEFRHGSEDLAGQARSGRLRPSRRQQQRPTSEPAQADATKFREDNGLPVERFPDTAQPPARRPEPVAVQREDEDFSQHTVLFDVDGPDQPPPAPTVDQTSDESARIDSRAKRATRPSESSYDFSQQRILLDATVESYRPDARPDRTSTRRDEEKRS